MDLQRERESERMRILVSENEITAPAKFVNHTTGLMIDRQVAASTSTSASTA